MLLSIPKRPPISNETLRSVLYLLPPVRAENRDAAEESVCATRFVAGSGGQVAEPARLGRAFQ
jgi:hypothetical protein